MTEEDLFDTYLDLALAGNATDPDDFLASEGAGTEVSEATRSRLHAIHRELGQRRHADSLLGPGRVLGDYRLIEPLGGGGMGLVFRAEQRSLGREVALKVVRPELVASPSSSARFRREAQALARLQHPHVVGLFDYGVVDDVAYMAMELLPGRGLDARLRDAAEHGETLPVADVLDWCAQLADGLQAAHEAGVVHRDVKPSNLRIDGDRAWLIDFGIARDLTDGAPTLTGAFAGSPPYAAPEQITGDRDDIGPRTDVYALGVTLYEALTGQEPFRGDGPESVMHRILTAEPADPRQLRPDMPRDLSVVVLKALEKDPARRYDSAAALASDLRAVRELRPIAARPPSQLSRAVKWSRRQPLAAAGLAAGLLAVAALAVGSIVQERVADQRRANQVKSAVDDARAAVLQHDTLSVEETTWAEWVLQREHTLNAEYFSPAARRRFEQEQGRLQASRVQRELLVQQALDSVSLAERLGDPDDPGLDAALHAIRVDLLASRWRARDLSPMARSSLGAQLERLDTEGRYGELLHPQMTVRLDLIPADAEVYAFTWRERSDLTSGGEPRLVPVPLGDASVGEGEPTVTPGTWALRVVAASGALRPDDLVFAVDGVDIEQRFAETPREDPMAPEGSALRVLRDGAWSDATAPADLEARVTAAPLLIESGLRLRPDPIGRVTLPAEPLLLVARRAGFETTRLLAEPPTTGGEAAVTLHLRKAGTAPEGFVRVEGLGLGRSPWEFGPFWMMETELTAGEYQAFLNAPEQLAAVDASEEPILFPRTIADRSSRWPRDDDGRFRLPDDVPADMPVLGVSWFDAQAYAAWRTRQAQAAGRDEIFSLPEAKEWVYAAGGSTGRVYPFGNSFRSWWTRSCFSTPTPASGPVLRYPVDESVFGLFDMAGSVNEWCQDWYEEARQRRHYAGGAWPYSEDGNSFRCWGANGGSPQLGYRTVGIRLVMRRAADVTDESSR